MRSKIDRLKPLRDYLEKEGKASVKEMRGWLSSWSIDGGKLAKSIKSKVIKKNNTDNREIQIEAGKWLQTLLINYEEKPFSDYDINYDYYLAKINKEILDLEPIITQLKLF